MSRIHTLSYIATFTLLAHLVIKYRITLVIFFSYLMVGIFTNLIDLRWTWVYINLIVFLIILIRGVLPRMRYDELIYLC